MAPQGRPIVAGEAVDQDAVAVGPQGNRPVARPVARSGHKRAAAAVIKVAAQTAHQVGEADRATHHISPWALKLTAISPATRTWSCTAIRSARPASTSSRVMAMSAVDGVGSPPG